MLDASFSVAQRITQATLGKSREDAHELLRSYFRRKFADRLIHLVMELQELRLDPNLRGADADRLTAAIERLAHLVHLKLASVNLVETLDRLATEPDGPDRIQLTQQVQDAQQRLGKQIKAERAELQGDLRHLRRAAQRERNAAAERAEQPLPAPPAQVSPQADLSPYVRNMARMSVRDANEALQDTSPAGVLG